MRLFLHLSSPDDPKRRLPDHEARAYLKLRLCQMFRGWTWEYAEHMIANRPDALREIFDGLAAQNAVNHGRDHPYVWWP